MYNFKLCQTSSKKEQEELPPPKATSLAELAVLTAAAEEEEGSEAEQQVGASGQLATPSSASEQTSLSSWNYSVPISPPPDFSDQQGRGSRSPGSPLDEIVDELSAIINHQGLDTLIKKQPDPRLAEIEAAKPNRLANFSIATAKSTTRIVRADSFQASGSGDGGAEAEVMSPGSGPLSLRSSSHISLNKLEQNGFGLGQRRSSSELSIGESPSLQSLEVIKGILNSRKNSLAESGGSASPTVEQPKSIREQEQEKEQEQPLKEQSTVDGAGRANSVLLIKQPSPVLQVQKSKAPPSPVPAQKSVPAPMPKPAAKSSSQQQQQVVSLVQQQSTSPLVAKKESPPVLKRESPLAAKKESPPVLKRESPPVQDSPPVLKKESPPPSAINRLLEESSPAPVQKLVTEQRPVTPTSPAPAPGPVTSPPVTMRGTITPVESPQPAKQPLELAPSSKPMPPTYRYSGPPSINFATWSERPKSQVAIKNEGDYIFGGQHHRHRPPS